VFLASTTRTEVTVALPGDNLRLQLYEIANMCNE